jgi:hypothetical protein
MTDAYSRQESRAGFSVCRTSRVRDAVRQGGDGCGFSQCESVTGVIADLKSGTLTLAAVWQPFDRTWASGREQPRTSEWPFVGDKSRYCEVGDGPRTLANMHIGGS